MVFPSSSGNKKPAIARHRFLCFGNTTNPSAISRVFDEPNFWRQPELHEVDMFARIPTTRSDPFNAEESNEKKPSASYEMIHATAPCGITGCTRG
jgi:hypothetical protein